MTTSCAGKNIKQSEICDAASGNVNGILGKKHMYNYKAQIQQNHNISNQHHM